MTNTLQDFHIYSGVPSNMRTSVMTYLEKVLPTREKESKHLLKSYTSVSLPPIFNL